MIRRRLQSLRRTILGVGAVFFYLHLVACSPLPPPPFPRPSPSPRCSTAGSVVSPFLLSALNCPDMTDTVHWALNTKNQLLLLFSPMPRPSTLFFCARGHGLNIIVMHIIYCQRLSVIRYLNDGKMAQSNTDRITSF